MQHFLSPVAAALRWRGALLCLVMLMNAARSDVAAAVAFDQPDLDVQRMLIVAVAEKAESAPAAGSTPRGYAGIQSYSGGARAQAEAARLAGDFGLSEVSAWTIQPLRLRCMLYRIPATADRAALSARLEHDPRVRLVQPLQSFDTYARAAAPGSAVDATASAARPYNDPYIDLQQGFSAIGASAAQQWSSGAGVRVALIDTGVDAGHPDLEGRIDSQRDFVNGAVSGAADRHGTEVAGVIAAVANNGVGIVGIAPAAQLLSYRACWPVQANASAARCNTFTLAQALGAAIASGAPILNLSLGGPADPLLEQLLRYAMTRGMIVVGAVPPDGRMDGFPVDVAGVIAVATHDTEHADAGALMAPGRDILTLEPGGHYDYASGSSLATAHVSGAIALLLALDRHLDAASAQRLLRQTARTDTRQIDVCAAAAALRRVSAGCAAPGA